MFDHKKTDKDSQASILYYNT